MLKKIIAIVSIVLLIVSLFFAGVFINFKNSYRYTVYQMNIGLKNKDTGIIKYYDIEKILNNNLKRTIQQSINLDKTLNRVHDNGQDVFALKMFDEMKDTLIKQKRIYIENDIKFNSPNLDNISDFQIFWSAFTNKPIMPNVTLKINKINKNKIEIVSEKGDEHMISLYEKIDNMWMLTDLY